MSYEANESPFLSSMDQVCSAQELEFSSGWARASRLIQIHNHRVEFEILPDRGMNVGRLVYRGVPFSWLSSVGNIAPAYYEPEGFGWLRTFSGGALVTCGLSQVGDPCIDDNEAYGLHGRVANIPARDVSVQRGWVNGEYQLQVRGTMHETRVFGESLELQRTITTIYKKPGFYLRDVVTNRGYSASPLMLLYHMNFGYPLLSPQARLLIPSQYIEPYDEAARARLEQHTIPVPPTPGYPEHVYTHTLHAEAEGRTAVALINESLNEGMGIVIEWKQTVLPHFMQWNMFAAGQYTVGLEPANCHVGGRAAERERGSLEYLQPGEQKIIELDISLIEGKPALAAVAAHIRSLQIRAI